MPNSRGRDKRANHLHHEPSADAPSPRLSLTPLEDIPIEDAFHEKEIFEHGDFERKLNPAQTSDVITISDRARNERIIEVYRRCFEAAGQHAQASVVRDFLAHFPHLAFDADWLKELVREPFTVSASKKRRAIFAAMSTGLRSAAKVNRRPAGQKFYRLSGAREAMHTIQIELTQWNDGLERGIATPEQVKAEAAKKADELSKTYRHSPPDRLRLRKILEHGQFYEAACLIAARAFEVRERDLQSIPR